jgi:ADP-heptose:LPS heptosyltransferase
MTETVLVARLDAMGDVLLAGPAVRAVAAAAGRVALLCGPRGRAAAELLPGVDDVVEWAAPWIEPEPVAVGAAHVGELLLGLARHRPERAVVLTSFHQSPLPLALLLRLAGVRRISAISDDFPGTLLDDRVADPGDVPEPLRALAVARAAGYELPPGDDGRLAVRRTLAAAPVEGRYVVLHPGTSVPARAWPVWRWVALAELLSRRGHRVVVTGGAAERRLTAEVAAANGADLGGCTDLAGLAAVLRGAEVVVAGNTGPAHLAAAVGTPVVSLFAPTVPAARWAPYGVPCVVLGDQAAPCAGSRARVCPVPAHPCLTSVDPGDVAAAVEALRAEAAA